MSSSVYVRSVSHIDAFTKTISSLEKLVSEIPKNKVRNELETKLMVAKVKKERYEALLTVTRLKTLINELDIWLTQNELTNEVKCLKKSRRAADDDLQRHSKKAKLDNENSNKAPRKYNTADTKPKTNSNNLSNENAEPQKPFSKSIDQPASKQLKNNKNSYRKGALANTVSKPEISVTKNKSICIYKDNQNSKQIVLSHSPSCSNVACNNGNIPTNINKKYTMHNQLDVSTEQPVIKSRDPRQLKAIVKYFIQKIDQKCYMKIENNIHFDQELTQTLQKYIDEEETPEEMEQTNNIYKEIMSHKATNLEHDARSISSIETKKI